MAEHAGKPKVRFAGFTEDWEQREFKNLFKILPNNTLSRAELSFEKGIVKNLHYGDILIKFNEILDSCDKKIPFISRDMNFEKIKNAILKNGDVVIADAAEDEAVGKCTEIFNISQNEQIISGLHTIPCRPNIDFAQGFLGYYMNSNSYHSQLVPLMQGIKVLSLSKSSLQDTLITFPRTKKEQARIGTFFRQLDRLVALHQRKRGRLENIKKAMLEKMFPKNGADVPEVRFAGFTEDWEQRNVGDLLIERDEQAPKSNKYPLMAFIANEGVAPKGERYDRSSLVTDTVNKLYKKTEFGDFIYSSNNLETGSIGLNNYGKASISPVYSIFFPTQIADSDFLGRRLVRKDFINEMVKWRQGVIYGQWRIHESDFVKIKIFVPSVEEQSRIGSFFRHLDRLITLHQRKVALLQNIKKACLEKMFV